MKNLLNRFLPCALCISGLMMLALWPAASTQAAKSPVVIQFNQVPCQFLESEDGVDRGFKSTRKEDCEAVNTKTGEQRIAESTPLQLKAGEYIFRVTNRNVPYELGFWLRGDGLANRALLPSVSGGGLTTGKTREYAISLKPGRYLYSCPLNPTPDYKLVVTE